MNSTVASNAEMKSSRGELALLRAGPYSLQETYASRFIDWYLEELSGQL
jgi:hypothetical protein